VLALVAAAYLLPLVVPVPLMEDDEGLHAAIAIEMVERGDWVVPRLMGEPFLDKPILYFWMQAASLAAFGASEFAVRLPGTLVALAGIAATGWLGRLLFGRVVGAWAAACYATMLLPYAVSLAPLHDLVMVPLVAVTIGAFWRLHRASAAGAAALWTGVAGLALGLSILGKGLTGVGLIGVGMISWMVWTRAWSLRLIVGATVALGIAALIAWPWYAAMEQASPGYLRYFILERHVGGVAGSTQRHAGRPFWYYMPVLALGAWPWIVAALSRSIPRADLAERLVWCWLIADVVLLTAAGSKLATYLLPAFPAIALLAARETSEHWSTTDAAPWRAVVLTSLLPLVGLAAAQWGLGVDPSGASGTATVVELFGVAVFVGGPLAAAGFFVVTSAGRRWSAAPTLLAVTALALVALSFTVRPLLAVQLTARSLADHVNRLGTMPQTLLIVDEGVGSFLFYLTPELRRGLTPDRVQRISRFSLGDARDPNGVLVAVAADRLDGVEELYDVPVHARQAVGSFHVWSFTDIHPKPQ
jgi:4-amino-4-deoxy-L-arabinose transferase